MRLPSLCATWRRPFLPHREAESPTCRRGTRFRASRWDPARTHGVVPDERTRPVTRGAGGGRDVDAPEGSGGAVGQEGGKEEDAPARIEGPCPWVMAAEFQGKYFSPVLGARLPLVCRAARREIPPDPAMH